MLFRSPTWRVPNYLSSASVVCTILRSLAHVFVRYAVTPFKGMAGTELMLIGVRIMKTSGDMRSFGKLCAMTTAVCETRSEENDPAKVHHRATRRRIRGISSWLAGRCRG